MIPFTTSAPKQELTNFKNNAGQECPLNCSAKLEGVCKFKRLPLERQLFLLLEEGLPCDR